MDIDLEQANMVYQANPDDVLAHPETLLKFIVHHKNNQVPRLRRLLDYYESQNTGINDVDSRRREKGKADYRASNAFAPYIANFQTAYSVGKPIGVQLDNAKHEILDRINESNDVDSHNYELFLDATIYGRAYELVYRNAENLEKFVRLSPTETFIIYTLDVDPKPAIGVRYHAIPNVDPANPTQKFVVEVWTDKQYIRYRPTNVAGSSLEVDVIEPRTVMPLIEYKNNWLRMGDFEHVLPLIDLYDAAQSDTANYMQDLNDALLVIQGDIGQEQEDLIASLDSSDPDYAQKVLKIKREFNEQIADTNTLLLHSGTDFDGRQTTVSAEYIYKQYDVQGTEAYKKRVADDIHKFSHTPNLTDENFASNVSGIAMKYKLLGTVELAATKRRMFEKGLYRRYSIVDNLERAVSSGWNIKVDDIVFTFQDNLPEDDLGEITALVQAGATLPQAYLYRYAPGITDPDEL
ncbi:phage portal protein, partial [Pediococcus pentosaceus]|uniref:phage portal protein n=1 Tax=Pediococcus pentosaceus TaxID=1255 RepID=UPI0039820303